MSGALISVRNLTKVYKTYERGSSFFSILKGLFVRKTILVEALKGISFDIDAGEIVGFLGPNGAGKSTTLKILTGILFPTDGTVNALSYVPWKQRKKYVAHIGAVFGQKSQLLWDIPPMDAFYLNKAIYDIPSVPFKKNLEHMIDLLAVGPVVQKPTRVLSLGERMKCEFIMAMLHNPRIMFLDEPTIGLDVIAKEKIREFIREMNRQGVTFILTTHDLDDVEALARRVLVINHGEIVFDNNLEQLSRYYGHRKKIRLVTDRELARLKVPGLFLLEQHSLQEAEFELDLEKTGLKQFISLADEQCSIRDKTVGEIPIERVIKELYTRQAN
jgi:ABC-2 type transport system ATP-binding protein